MIKTFYGLVSYRVNEFVELFTLAARFLAPRGTRLAVSVAQTHKRFNGSTAIIN